MPFTYCCCVNVLDRFPSRVLYFRTILFLLGLLTFPLSILILNIYTYCKFGLCCWHYEFWDKHFWFRTRVLQVEKFSPDITELTKRYMKNPPLESYEMLKKFITENRLINRMLVAANDGLPNHFFHVELSGSLAERFGKPLPSNSHLASDYDLMLVPSRLTVYIENKWTKKTNEPLIARKNLHETQKEDEPFYWIELPEHTHYYLQNTCLQYYNYKGSTEKEMNFLISSATIKPILKEEIDKVVRMEPLINYMKVEIGGPAVNVKCKKNKQSKDLQLEVDMTLALPCFHWPDRALPWFDREHRWIGAKKEYDYKTRLKMVGLHLVPKQSLDFAQEILLNKPQMPKNKTKYPCLEWRLSFSLPELVISQHVPEIVRWAYLMLKSTIKRHQKHYASGNKFPSYCLKNTLFWYMDTLDLQKCIELHNVQLPDRHNFDKDIFEKQMWFVIDGLIGQLSEFIQRKHVPHYFWNRDKYNLVTSDDQLDSVRELLNMLQTDDKNQKLLMLSHMEADLEMAHKKIIKLRSICCCCYYCCIRTTSTVKKKRDIDKHWELQKFIYTGKNKENIFKVFDCLPCGACDCLCIEFCHMKDEKVFFHEY